MKGKSKMRKEEAQVEELLKSVEDEMLLNLSLNSHSSRVSPNYIDSDLDHRFRALKSRNSSSSSSSLPNPKPTASSSSSPPKNHHDHQSSDSDLESVLGGDLAARFSALRASLPKPENDSVVLGDEEDEEEDEDEEVERLVRWAKDAARLDPSPPSDDDDDDDSDFDDKDEDDRQVAK